MQTTSTAFPRKVRPGSRATLSEWRGHCPRLQPLPAPVKTEAGSLSLLSRGGLPQSPRAAVRTIPGKVWKPGTTYPRARPTIGEKITIVALRSRAICRGMLPGSEFLQGPLDADGSRRAQQVRSDLAARHTGWEAAAAGYTPPCSVTVVLT